MAIIRQRLPIPGPFDIRIGLPRGKHWDPKRHKKQMAQKANPNTSLNRFRSYVSAGEGLYRPSKFLVVLEFPEIMRSDETFKGTEWTDYQTDFNFMQDVKQNVKDRLFFFCSSAKLPERTIQDTSANQFYGPERNIARGLEFAPMDLTFMLDSELSERVIFEAWQNCVVNQKTFNLNYYDEYVGKVLIFPLHENRAETANDKMTEAAGQAAGYGPMARLSLTGYYVELLEAYPKTIGAVDLSYANTNTFANQTVTFNYRYWRSNATLNRQEDAYAEGDIDGVGVIKESRFPIGGWLGKILQKLPPEIRRAGRDVLQQVKTRFPTGRIFGGKVFPPFF